MFSAHPRDGFAPHVGGGVSPTAPVYCCVHLWGSPEMSFSSSGRGLGVPHRAPSWHPAVLCSLRTRERLWDLLLKDNQEQMPGSSGILQCEELYFPSLHRRGVVLFCCFFNLGALGLFFAAVVVLSIVCFVWNCLLFLFSSNPHL